MTGRRRKGLQRAERQAASVAAELRNARARTGESRDAVALRAGVSPDSVRRCELADARVQLDTLCSVGEALGLDIVLHVYPGHPVRLRDSGQLAFERLLTLSAHSSWKHSLEVPAGDHGQAIDLCLFGATEILAVEIDRLILDFQDRYRRNLRKRDHLAARHQRPVRLVMVVQDTERNRRAIQPHIGLIRTILPAGSREILAAIRRGRPLGRDGLLWLRQSALRDAVT